MSAEVLAFPSHAFAAAQGEPLRRRADPLATASFTMRPRRFYSFADMVKLCGLDQLEPRTAIEHLRLLAKQKGLPLPRNPRLYAGLIQTGPRAIGQRSQWDALAVDAWFDQPPPPGGGAAMPVPHEQAVPPLPAPRRIAMADRARQLASGSR